MDHVRGAVIRTLAFQAAWGYAPTRLQLAMFLDAGSIGVETSRGTSLPINTINIPAVMNELDRLIAEGFVCESRGHIVLKSFVEQIDRGREREFYFPRKLRHARRVASYLSRLPWVRAVCLCNTTALGQARDEGDLDFFIIAKAGSIWRTRFFATLPFKLLGARPSSVILNVGEESAKPINPSVIPAQAGIQKNENQTGWIPGSRQTRPRMTKGVDPICLSFFIADDALDLSHSMLSEDDPYFRYWFLSLLPLTDDGVLKDLWEQNPKIRRRHPLAKKWMALDSDDFLKNKSKYQPIVESWLEKKLKILQQRQFPSVIKEVANQGTRVVVSDQMLKFHVEDRRSEYRQRYYEICKQFRVNP